MINERILYKNPNRRARILVGKKWIAEVIATTHFHPEIELILVTSGSIRIMTHNQEIVGKTGDILFVGSFVPHLSEFMENDTSQGLVQFRIPSALKNSLKYLSNFVNQSSLPLFKFTRDDPDYEEMFSYMSNMLSQSKQKSISTDYYVTSNIYSILAVLYKKHILLSVEQAIDLSAVNKFLPAIEFIETHFYEEITLKDLAQKVKLNKDYFCRVFKKSIGTTAIDYLNFVRVCKAQEMLAQQKSITEISYSVGFSSTSYFVRTFKKYNKCSPSAYRKMYSHLQNYY